MSTATPAFPIDFRTEFRHLQIMVTLTLEGAQHSLKSLAERVLQGEAVFIRVEGTQELLSLHNVPSELPPNYLAQCYGPEEIAEEEYLAGFARTRDIFEPKFGG